MTPFSFCSKQKKFILTRINIVEYYSILFNLYFIQKLSSYNSNLSKKQNKKAKTNFLKNLIFKKRSKFFVNSNQFFKSKIFDIQIWTFPTLSNKKETKLNVMKNLQQMDFFIFILISFQTKKSKISCISIIHKKINMKFQVSLIIWTPHFRLCIKIQI